jgi:hypothetical protein
MTFLKIFVTLLNSFYQKSEAKSKIEIGAGGRYELRKMEGEFGGIKNERPGRGVVGLVERRVGNMY